MNLSCDSKFKFSWFRFPSLRTSCHPQTVLLVLLHWSRMIVSIIWPSPPFAKKGRIDVWISVTWLNEVQGILVMNPWRFLDRWLILSKPDGFYWPVTPRVEVLPMEYSPFFGACPVLTVTKTTLSEWPPL